MDMVTGPMDPVLMLVMSELALHQPAAGTVQPFILETLEAGAARPPRPFTPHDGDVKPGEVNAGADADAEPRSLRAYFQDAVDPLLAMMLRAVAVSEPPDVKQFLIDLCKEHPDMESAVMGPAAGAGAGAAAGAGDAASTVKAQRCGMRLGKFKVMLTMKTAEDGSANIRVHCPLTNREADVTVPAGDKTLNGLMDAHGSAALYFFNGVLDLTEDDAGKFVLTWGSSS